MTEAAPRAVLAIDVGGTGIKAAVIDAHGVTTRSSERATPAAHGPAAIVDALRAVARELTGPDVCAVGVVVPGSVDVAAGVGRYSANLGWRDVPLRDLLGADLGQPVVVEHDVRAAGLAERTLGRAAGLADGLIMVIGTGIAGVIISGGTVLRGATDLAGEIGHIPVYPDGEPCACGQRGCLETYASGAAIARRYRHLGDDLSAGRGGDSDSWDARKIAAARDTDARAARVWGDATTALGLALATYTLLLDPVAIVLGGGLAEAGERLVEPVRAALAERLTWRSAPAVEVSALASRAGQQGAAVLAWQSIGWVDFDSWRTARHS